MLRTTLLAFTAAASIILTACSSMRSTSDATDIPPTDQTLDQLHAAASVADEAKYFSLFAPEAVFIGTDPSEIWTIEEFRAYAHERFKTGKGWTYHVKHRHVHIDEPAGYAFFEETLSNDKYGECRGTGVLRFTDGSWKIAQYSLSVPIPNDLTLDVVKLIKNGQR